MVPAGISLLRLDNVPRAKISTPLGKKSLILEQAISAWLLTFKVTRLQMRSRELCFIGWAKANMSWTLKLTC
jgi:hypothetical protein